MKSSEVAELILELGELADERPDLFEPTPAGYRRLRDMAWLKAIRRGASLQFLAGLWGCSERIVRGRIEQVRQVEPQLREGRA